MDDSEQIWHLIAKALNQEISPSDHADLMEKLRQDPRLFQQYELLSRIWRDPSGTHIDHETAKASITRIIEKAGADTADEDDFPTPDRRRSRRIRRIVTAFGALLIVLAAAWQWLPNRPLNAAPAATPIEESLVAQKGSRTRSLLPDGTTVWLNAGSELHVENDFQGNTRDVTLKGEGYFDVARQPDRPFIVHASGYDIKVLGTVFNVKAYPGDPLLETTLLRGSVKVFREQSPETSAVELKPNHKLIISLDDATVAGIAIASPVSKTQAEKNFRIEAIDSTKKETERFETAWVYSRLEFRGDSFEELAQKIGRWYNLTVIFTDEKVKTLRFNGSFEKETAEQALEALRTAVPLFRYVIRNHEVTIGSVR